MASSRLEKIGTIFTRVEGLLKSGAMKFEERPIWYDVYKAFPPKDEPRYARPTPNIPIREILYEEDKIRAKYHKDTKSLPSYNLSDNKHKTTTQQFIAIYNKLKDEGALSDDQIYATAVDLLENEISLKKAEKPSEDLVKEKIDQEDLNINLKDIFK